MVREFMYVFEAGCLQTAMSQKNVNNLEA